MIKSTLKARGRVAVTAMIFGCLVTPARAEITVEGFLWMLTADTNAAADFRSGLANLRDYGVDFEQEETIPGARLTMGGTHQLSVSVFELDFGESRQNRVDLETLGLPVQVVADLDADFKGSFARAEYRLNLDAGILSGGVLAGAQYIDIDAVLAVQRAGSVSADGQSVMPFVGFHAQAHPLPFLSFQAIGAFSIFDVDDTVTQYTDVEVSANLHPLPFLFLGAGYRHIGIDIDPDGALEFDITLSGPVLYGGFEF